MREFQITLATRHTSSDWPKWFQEAVARGDVAPIPEERGGRLSVLVGSTALDQKPQVIQWGDYVCLTDDGTFFIRKPLNVEVKPKDILKEYVVMYSCKKYRGWLSVLDGEFEIHAKTDKFDTFDEAAEALKDILIRAYVRCER